jgi:hypothetical protein
VVDRALWRRLANEEETLLAVVFVSASRLNQWCAIGAVVGFEWSLFTFWRKLISCAQLVFENLQQVFFLVVGRGKFVFVFVITTLRARALFFFGVVEVQSLVIGRRFLGRRSGTISGSVVVGSISCIVCEFVVTRVVCVVCVDVIECIGVNLETFETFKVVRVDTFGC